MLENPFSSFTLITLNRHCIFVLHYIVCPDNENYRALVIKAFTEHFKTLLKDNLTFDIYMHYASGLQNGYKDTL